MYLLHAQSDGTFGLGKFAGDKIPRYAILSHTWEADNQEVTFEDLTSGMGSAKIGYRKIQFCGAQAIADGLQYFWIDSCCIDKSSSAELSEAINSMFRWYRKAAKCYVFLSDVPTADCDEQTFHRSRWFTRGWTLQELLAPREVEFFSRDGAKLGNKQSLQVQIQETTGIPAQALQEPGDSLFQFSIEERLSWTEKRETTIEEDQAYCLLGIFDVYLPLIYGEGKEHAFRRLRKEITTAHARDTPQFFDASIAEKTNVCLANLAATDQSRFVSQALRRSRDACAWILKNQKYLSWFESDESSFLWMMANPGCGKTTIAAHISHMISSNQTPQQPVSQNKAKCVVLFFFFRKSNQEGEKTALAALRTLVSQLAQQEPQALPTLLKRHELLSAKGDFEWSSESLSGVFDEMLKQQPPGTHVHIVLDAIDECETESRISILEWAEGLVHEHAALAVSPSVLKVLVTSRPTGGITDHLSGYPTLAITAADTSNDIQALIHTQVEELAQRRRLSADISQTIIQFLEENAHGMFLWVLLIMKELERRDERLSDEVIASKLSKIPLTLFDTYQAIIDNTLPTRKQDMWRIIRWLVFGGRSLTIAELEKGLCLETGISNWYDFVGDLNFLCGSLIRLDGPREEVNFVHQTARTFLETLTQNSVTVDFGEIAMYAPAANEHLAEICVRYLLRPDLFSKLNQLLSRIRRRALYIETVQDVLDQDPFLLYAIENWAFHLRAIDMPTPATSALVRKLLATLTARDGIMTLTFFINKQKSWSVPKNQTPLHLAAYFNIPWLAQIYISENKASIYATTPMKDSPLIWASEMGSTECVQRLLDAGADPKQFEVDNWSALHWAARNGHTAVAALLLDHGAPLSQPDRSGHTPLDWAFDREHSDVVRLFEEWILKNDPGGEAKYSKQDYFRRAMNHRASQKTGQLWDYRP